MMAYIVVTLVLIVASLFVLALAVKANADEIRSIRSGLAGLEQSAVSRYTRV